MKNAVINDWLFEYEKILDSYAIEIKTLNNRKSVGFNKAKIGAGVDKNITLHECRSLSERLYRTQGIDTRVLLGHLHQRTTDMYNDARGLNENFYTVLKIK